MLSLKTTMLARALFLERFCNSGSGDPHDFTDSLYSLGVFPICFLKIFEKYCTSIMPQY